MCVSVGSYKTSLTLLGLSKITGNMFSISYHNLSDDSYWNIQYCIGLLPNIKEDLR